MDTGTKISGILHLTLIGWVLADGVISSSFDTPETISDVSIITADDFAALTAYQTPPTLSQDILTPAPATDDADALPEITPDAPISEVDQPDTTAAPDTETNPEFRDDLTAPQIPTPDTAMLVPQLPDAPQNPEVPIHSDDAPALAQSDRVSPDPVAPPPPDVATGLENRPEISSDAGAEADSQTQTAQAEEAASDRIVTEAEADERAAPTPFVPPRLRPAGLKLPEPAPTPEPEQPSQTQTAQTPTNSNDSAPADGQGTDDVPVASGPPLTAGEKDGLRVAVQKCWNVGSLSTDALQVTVTIGVSMSQDGKPDIGSIRQIDATGGSDRAIRTAYEAGRRAIIRCGSKGFDLPLEKYDQWRNIEITFNPERMRIK